MVATDNLGTLDGSEDITPLKRFSSADATMAGSCGAGSSFFALVLVSVPFNFTRNGFELGFPMSS